MVKSLCCANGSRLSAIPLTRHQLAVATPFSRHSCHRLGQQQQQQQQVYAPFSRRCSHSLLQPARMLVCRTLPARVTPRIKAITLGKTLDTEATLETMASLDGTISDSDEDIFNEDYKALNVGDIVKERTGWLAVFCTGLIIAAGVVEGFDDLISRHVELSFFVPLIMGHGGNTGSQTTCAVIRAQALKQIHFRDMLLVVSKEAAAGCFMGAALGLCIYLLTMTTHAVTQDVGLVVAISLPVVSIWANTLGASLTMATAHCGLDPALTSAPLVTTIVDTTGLVIYFKIAAMIIGQDSLLAT